MVRCGVCQNVFSGMANLRHVDEILRQRGGAQAAAEQALPPRASIKPLVKPAGSGDQKSRNAPNTFAQTDLRTAFFLPETVFGPTTEMVAEGESFLSEPAAVPRSIQPQPGQSSASASASTAVADGIVAAKDDAASIALRQPGPDTRIRWAQEAAQVNASTQAPSPETAPASISSDRRKRGSRRRSSQERDRSDEAIAYFEPEASVGGYNSRSQAFGWLFCVFAAGLLAIQLVIGARNSLSSNFPALRTPLQWLASPLGLTVEAPLDLHALTIESFELQAGDSPGLLTLSALLRNRASRATQWPALEIVLTDGQGTLLVRKVLLPKDYFAGLPAAATRQVESGIGARAELPLKLSLEARDLAASGYSVTLFYP